MKKAAQKTPAGLKAGDVVTEVDGKPVKEVTELQKVISNYKPGQTAKIKVVSYTDKKSRTVDVKIGTLPEEAGDRPASPEGRSDEPDKLGLIVGVRGKDIVVHAVQPGSIGEQAGFEPGDIIVRINRKPIDSTAIYKKQVASSGRLFIELKRKGRTLFVQISVPE